MSNFENNEFSATLRNYYRGGKIRERMYEFLGAARLDRATSVYIVGGDGCTYQDAAPPRTLPEYLEAGCEVERSLWDRHALIVDIDIEYQNFDFAWAAWLNPKRAFTLQACAMDATLRLLQQAGLQPLILMSGRGFHLLWSVARSSAAFGRLTGLGRVPPTLQTRYARPVGPSGIHVEPDLGRAYAGLSMVLEFLGHRVITAAACSIPVQLTAIEVGPGACGREIVSFDLSEYGDPLYLRHVRLPFSAYLKPRQLEWALGKAAVDGLLPMFEIPVAGLSLDQAIVAMRSSSQASAQSQFDQMYIPDQSEPTGILLDFYESSTLAAFHQQFYGELGDFSSLSDPLRALSIPEAPTCVNWLLSSPNDRLLKPAALQHVTRVLTALGWSGTAIAGLICQCYQMDWNWGDIWDSLDPTNRAVFYTRLFRGMIATGTDRLIDFNCVSHQEKGQCMVPECCSNLITYRDMLMNGG